MITVLFIFILAILGIKTQDVHKKMREILKEKGYKLGFYIKYNDIIQFLNDNNSDLQKDKLRKLAKAWIYLVIAAGTIVVASVVIVTTFPSFI